MKRKVRGCISILGIVALFSLGAWLLMPRPPLLLEKAKQVYSFKEESDIDIPENYEIGIQWLSDTMFLHSRWESSEKNKRPMVYRYDLIAGRDTGLPDLTTSLDAFNKTKIMNKKYVNFGKVERVQMSPNGKWLLCLTELDWCMLAEVDGKQFHYYHVQRENYFNNIRFHWLPDSRHWIDEYARDDATQRLVMHDVLNSKFSQSLPYNRPLTDLVACSENDRIFCLEWPDVNIGKAKTRQVAIVERSLASNAIPVVRHTLTIPVMVMEDDFVLSPDHQHVAWIVNEQKSDPVGETLHKYFQMIKPLTVRRSTIWVSDLDGHAHEVGRIEIPVDVEAERRVHAVVFWGIADLKWLPSGKALRFQHDGSLYTVLVQ